MIEERRNFYCPQWFMQTRKWGNFMILRMPSVEYEPGLRLVDSLHAAASRTRCMHPYLNFHNTSREVNKLNFDPGARGLWTSLHLTSISLLGKTLRDYLPVCKFLSVLQTWKFIKNYLIFLIFQHLGTCKSHYMVRDIGSKTLNFWNHSLEQLLVDMNEGVGCNLHYRFIYCGIGAILFELRQTFGKFVISAALLANLPFGLRYYLLIILLIVFVHI